METRSNLLCNGTAFDASYGDSVKILSSVLRDVPLMGWTAALRKPSTPLLYTHYAAQRAISTADSVNTNLYHILGSPMVSLSFYKRNKAQYIIGVTAVFQIYRDL